MFLAQDLKQGQEYFELSRQVDGLYTANSHEIYLTFLWNNTHMADSNCVWKYLYHFFVYKDHEVLALISVDSILPVALSFHYISRISRKTHDYFLITCHLRATGQMGSHVSESEIKA